MVRNENNQKVSLNMVFQKVLEALENLLTASPALVKEVLAIGFGPLLLDKCTDQVKLITKAQISGSEASVPFVNFEDIYSTMKFLLHASGQSGSDDIL